MRVVIAGGTGLIGQALIEYWLQQARHALPGDSPQPSLPMGRPEQITVLTRQRGAADVLAGDPRLTYVAWDEIAATDSLQAADVVVNLAGATLSRRWSADYKKRILDSRLHATRTIVEALNGHAQPNAVLISASAIGYYGTSLTQTFTEDDHPGNDFLATVCARWEAAAMAITTPGVRVIPLRIGLVLAKHGGALPKMMLPFRFGVGGPLGSGQQWMSWIHVQDLCRMIDWISNKPKLSGPINAVAPQPVQNRTFTQHLARVLRRPHLISAPALVMRLLLGEMSVLLLEGQRVLPRVAQTEGFQFTYPNLTAALSA